MEFSVKLNVVFELSIITRLRVVDINFLRLSFTACCIVIFLSACSSQLKENNNLKLGDAAYNEWVQEVENVFEDKEYLLPEYDSNVGSLEMVYEMSPTSYSLALYRSDKYSIQEKLSGLHNIHDLYYSYSYAKGEKNLADREILSRFGFENEINRKKIAENQFVLNNRLLEYRNAENDLRIYELKDSQDSKERADVVMSFLENKGVKSGRVLIFDLVEHTNLEFSLEINNNLHVITFTIQDIQELKKYLANLSKG